MNTLLLQFFMIIALFALIAAKQVSFNTIFTIKQISSKELRGNAMFALRESLSSTLNIPLKTILNGKVTEEDKQSLKVAFPIELEASSYPLLHNDAVNIFFELSHELKKVVDSGSFTETLKNALISYNALQSSAMEISEVHFAEFSIAKDHVKVAKYEEEEESEEEQQLTQFPTSAPTSSPSFAPTSHSTSIQNHGSTQFKAYFGLYNVTASEIECQQVFLQTISEVTDIELSEIEFMGITNSKNISSSFWNMVIEIQFTLPVNDYPQLQYNPTAIFNSVKQSLEEAILTKVSGKSFSIFTEQLRLNAAMNECSDLSITNVLQVAFTDFELISNNNNHHHDGNNNNNNDQPTVAPTLPPVTPEAPQSVSIDSYWGLQDLQNTNILSSQGQIALIQSIANILDISVNSIQFINTVQSTPGAQVEVFIRIIANYQDFPEFQNNGTKIVLFITHLLSTVVDDHSFTDLLRTEGNVMQADELKTVTVFRVAFNVFNLIAPTASPTIRPTVVPTQIGSSAPSNNNVVIVPSAAPTAAPSVVMTPTITPTHAPHATNTMNYQLHFLIHNVTANNFSSNSEHCLLETIDYFHQLHGFSMNSMEITGNHHQSENRRLLRGVVLSQSSSSQSTFSVSVQLSLFVGDNNQANEVYNQSTSLVEVLIGDKQFEKKFRQLAVASQTTESYNATIGAVEFSAMEFQSKSNSNSSASLSLGELIGIIVGGAIALMLLSFFVARYYQQQQAEEARKSALVKYDDLFDASEKFLAVNIIQDAYNAPKEEIDSMDYMSETFVNRHGFDLGEDIRFPQIV